jgi:hypothetical protein
MNQKMYTLLISLVVHLWDAISSFKQDKDFFWRDQLCKNVPLKRQKCMFEKLKLVKFLLIKELFLFSLT